MKTKTNLDFLGMILSFGCVIHCLLLPIIIPLLPSIGFVFGHDSYTHLILSVAISIIAVFALIPGYFKHKVQFPIVIASFGIIVIISMGVLERHTESMVITATTIVGSILVIIGHYLNHKYSCSCEHPRHKHDHDKEDECH